MAAPPGGRRLFRSFHHRGPVPLPLVLAAAAAVAVVVVMAARVRARGRDELQKISGGRKSLVSNLFKR